MSVIASHHRFERVEKVGAQVLNLTTAIQPGTKAKTVPTTTRAAHVEFGCNPLFNSGKRDRMRNVRSSQPLCKMGQKHVGV